MRPNHFFRFIAYARFLMALWAGKLGGLALRLFGRGATSLPGEMARRIDPAILTRLATQVPLGTVFVTGTNGKTTTTNMLAESLRQAKLAVIHNRSGANMINGITTAFLDSTTFFGHVTKEIALIEVDEGTIPRALSEIAPRIVVVTNFFRDQLDRYAEVTMTVDRISKALGTLPAETHLVLNADDPLTACLGKTLNLPVIWYGVDSEKYGTTHMTQVMDARHCIRCGQPYQYEIFTYGQLGKYKCPRCGDERPAPQIAVKDIEMQGLAGSKILLSTPKGEFWLPVKIPGFYNIYNAAAAAAAALRLNLSPIHVQDGLSSFSTTFGRMEYKDLGGVKALISLVKNPVGFNEVIRTLVTDPEPKSLLFIINDLAADGRDISWLWDVDFEMLQKVKGNIRQIIVSGLRAEDMAIRLKYAGVTNHPILEKDIGKAVDRLIAENLGETAAIMPTYTALLQLEEILAQKGYGKKRYMEASS